MSGDMIQKPPETDPAPEGNANTAVAWFRFFIWLMPTALVVVLSMLLTWIFLSLGKRGMFSGWQDAGAFGIVFWLAGAMVGTLGLGYLDARLKRQQQRISRDNDRFDDGWHVLKFFLLQLALVPFLSVAVAIVMGIVARAAGR